MQHSRVAAVFLSRLIILSQGHSWQRSVALVSEVRYFREYGLQAGLCLM